MSPLPYILNLFTSPTITVNTPSLVHRAAAAVTTTNEALRPTSTEGLVLEAWAEGFMLGSLIIMTAITISNMRKGNLLHKLIFAELILGYWQGCFILFAPPIYAWWLSAAAIPLNISWWLHNIIAWMKLKPFMKKWQSRVFFWTIIAVLPYWGTEIAANFLFFHNINDLFLRTRPWEALCRDPWWIIAVIGLAYIIKTQYDLTLVQIAKISPRFAVMLVAMLISIVFIILDICSVTGAFKSVLPVGINPFWKLSFVFKCLTDSVVLDDFKTALDRLRKYKISNLGSFAFDPNDAQFQDQRRAMALQNGWTEPTFGQAFDARHLSTPRVAEVEDLVDGEPPVRMTEVRRPDILRVASRDRDDEENDIVVVAPVTEPQRTWPRKPSNQTSTTSCSEDYANAMRQVTRDDHRPSDSSENRSSPKTSRTGRK